MRHRIRISITFYFPVLFLLFGSSLQVAGQKYMQASRLNDQGAGITLMTVDEGRSRLITADVEGSICFRNISTGAIEKKIKSHGARVNTLAFNSTGKLLISSTPDGEIKIFDFDKDKIVQSVYSPDYSGIRFVLFSIADGFIYFNGNNRLYKTRSDLTQHIDQIQEEKDTIYDAVITRDRSALIYSTGNILKVMNTRSDVFTQEISSGTSPIERLSLVRDSMLVSWSKDGTIAFRTYKLGQLSAQPVFWFKGGNPSTMNFSSDGTTMVSGNIGNWARIWNPFDRSILQELFGHQSIVTSSEFGSDESILYTGSLDGCLIQWKKSLPTPSITPPPPPAAMPVAPAAATPQILPPEPKVPEVIMTEQNIPKVIQGRKVIQSETIELNSPTLVVYVYDNSFIDGDTMSIFFNGEWLLDHYGVTKTKKAITLEFKPNTNNFLVLFANNLGKSPPNTAAILFSDGKTQRFVKLSSDLKTCSALNFIYKK